MPTTYELHFRGGLFILRTKAFLVYGQNSVPVKHTSVSYTVEEYARLNSTFWVRFLSGRDPLYSVPPEYRKKSCLEINLRWQNSLLLALMWCVVMNGLVLEFNGLY